MSYLIILEPLSSDTSAQLHLGLGCLIFASQALSFNAKKVVLICAQPFLNILLFSYCLPGAWGIGTSQLGPPELFNFSLLGSRYPSARKSAHTGQLR